MRTPPGEQLCDFAGVWQEALCDRTPRWADLTAPIEQAVYDFQTVSLGGPKMPRRAGRYLVLRNRARRTLEVLRRRGRARRAQQPLPPRVSAWWSGDPRGHRTRRLPAGDKRRGRLGRRGSHTAGTPDGHRGLRCSLAPWRTQWYLRLPPPLSSSLVLRMSLGDSVLSPST